MGLCRRYYEGFQHIHYFDRLKSFHYRAYAIGFFYHPTNTASQDLSHYKKIWTRSFTAVIIKGQSLLLLLPQSL